MQTDPGTRNGLVPNDLEARGVARRRGPLKLLQPLLDCDELSDEVFQGAIELQREGGAPARWAPAGTHVEDRDDALQALCTSLEADPFEGFTERLRPLGALSEQREGRGRCFRCV